LKHSINITKIWIPFCIFLGCIQSCRSLREEEKLDRVPFKKENEIVEAVDNISRQRPNTFFTKIKLAYSDESRNIKVKATVNLVKDSAMTTVISYANIPIVSALVRPDSVIISNKKDKCFTRADVNYLKENFSIDFSFKNLEQLFLGMPIDFNPNTKYEKFSDPHFYIISSHKKRQIRREKRGNRDILTNRNEQDSVGREIIYKYYLGKDMKSLKRMFINSIDDSTTININYFGRDTIQGFLVPFEAEMTITTPRKVITIYMTYKESEVNNTLHLVFKIPENYVDCSQKNEEEEVLENKEQEQDIDKENTEPSAPEEPTNEEILEKENDQNE
jgi:hypothetical protein